MSSSFIFPFSTQAHTSSLPPADIWCPMDIMILPSPPPSSTIPTQLSASSSPFPFSSPTSPHLSSNSTSSSLSSPPRPSHQMITHLKDNIRKPINKLNLMAQLTSQALKVGLAKVDPTC